nr:MAG TPA: hypothetical protein [Caudoviricetes sp.]
MHNAIVFKKIFKKSCKTLLTDGVSCGIIQTMKVAKRN